MSVNGKDLGLYVHVEEMKAPFLLRHFERAEGNLYEGTVSDFTPTYRGTIEKKTNTDAADWSDIDAVVAALQDPSDAGLKALGEIVDLDRFLSFWATEVLVGHWDGYAGGRNNYHFYREPDGPFVFIPWGTDDTFHLKDDPNPFDNISNPPPSVLALTAIPNRLYNDGDWRVEYAARLTEILDTVWDEEELLAVVDEMAAIVQQHARYQRPRRPRPPTPNGCASSSSSGEARSWPTSPLTPPDWPEPEAYVPPSVGSGTLAITFQTTWGSNLSANPLESRDDRQPSAERVRGIGRRHGSLRRSLQPGGEGPASGGRQARVHSRCECRRRRLHQRDDARCGPGPVGGGSHAGHRRRRHRRGDLVHPARSVGAGRFSPFTEGVLKLSTAGTTPGATIVGTFSGVYGYAPSPSGGDGPDGEGADPGTAAVDAGPVINEIAAKGDPLDWFELHNPSPDPIALDGFEVADTLTDAGKRVAFPAGTIIQPGAYMQFTVDKDGWPGFALGGDEELGIWRLDGTHVDSVDWNEGQSSDGQSYARVPDGTGDFQTVDNPTPGAANQP